MKITKFGHCCMLVEEAGVRIMIDPGTLSSSQNDAEHIDIILITHEHQDHLHVESLKEVHKKNPNSKVITNKSVGRILDQEKIAYQLLEHRQSCTHKSVAIEGCGDDHAIIYPTLPLVQNTGFFIANKLYFPGDSFFDPQKRVKILALPVAGPWMKLSDAIDFAIKIKPQVCLPVHDAILKISFNKYTGQILEQNGIKFVAIEDDKEYEF